MRPWGTCGYCGGRGPEPLAALALRRARLGAPAPGADRGLRDPGAAEPVPTFGAPEPMAATVVGEEPTVADPVRAADAPTSPVPATRRRRPFRPIDLWKRYLPPVRLVWIFLGILVAAGGGFLNRAEALPLLALPLLGAFADLAFQRIRFPRLRFPDAAIATGLFLSIIIWPANFDLPLVAVAVITVAVRHLLRQNGHPFLNPAAVGVVVATVVFALPTSWHLDATVGMAALVVALGAILIVKAPHTWRFPAYFYSAYLLVGANAAYLLGGPSNTVLFLTSGTLTAGSIFFALFMVSEPRTAPSARWAMPIFALVVGAATAGLPVLFGEYAVLGPLGVLSPFLALFIGNGLTVAWPAARGAVRPTAPAPTLPARTTARGGPALRGSRDLAR